MRLDQIFEQQEKDRADLANLPNGTLKPISWCNEHDCKLGTCFPLHYPESSISTVIQDEDVPKLITSEEFKEDVRKAINKQIDDQENWIKLWKQSRR